MPTISHDSEKAYQCVLQLHSPPNVGVGPQSIRSHYKSELVCYRETQRLPVLRSSLRLSFPLRLSDFPTLYHVVFIELPGASVFVSCCWTRSQYGNRVCERDRAADCRFPPGRSSHRCRHRGHHCVRRTRRSDYIYSLAESGPLDAIVTSVGIYARPKNAPPLLHDALACLPGPQNGHHRLANMRRDTTIPASAPAFRASGGSAGCGPERYRAP